MCQLFGLNSRQNVSPAFSLKGFFCRGGGTDEHADGWGLAHFQQNRAVIRTRISAAFECPQARAMLDQPLSATTVMAHIRKATIGNIAPENTHPFVRHLWGDEWVFAHNGDLKNYRPELHWPFMARGETDSEQAFCHLLNVLQQQFGGQKPAVNVLADSIKQWSDTVAQQGTLNFLLSNGKYLFAYCSTDLYWTQRAAPFGQVTLVDCDASMDFSRVNNAQDHMHLIATRPLTRGENWYPMSRGELRVFSEGSVLLVKPGLSVDAPLVNHAAEPLQVVIA